MMDLQVGDLGAVQTAGAENSGLIGGTAGPTEEEHWLLDEQGGGSGRSYHHWRGLLVADIRAGCCLS